MPTALRDIYLAILFLLCAGAFFAPYLGIELPIFPFQATAGKTVNLPVSAALYSLFLMVSIATFAKRLLSKSESSEEVHVSE